jgi:hypothetical protein
VCGDVPCVLKGYSLSTQMRATKVLAGHTRIVVSVRAAI